LNNIDLTAQIDTSGVRLQPGTARRIQKQLRLRRQKRDAKSCVSTFGAPDMARIKVV
jgi:hypothetical protein